MTAHIELNTYTPPETGVTAAELREWIRRESSRLTRELEKIGQCQHCTNFRDGYCERWAVEVPEEHRAQGCEDWVIDLIPF
jgi:hypothetical protein